MLATPRFPRIYNRSGGPIAWFPGDWPRPTRPGDSGDVYDLTGAMSAAVAGGAKYTYDPGPASYVLGFGGATGYARTPGNLALSGDPALTLAFSAVFTDSTSRSVLGWGDAFGSGASGFAVFYCTRGANLLSVEFFNSNYAYVATPVSENSWHRIVVAKVPGAINTTTSIYVDGVYLGPNHSGSSTSTPNITASPFTLGQAANDTTDNNLQGAIGNVQIYNYAWGQGDVTRDYRDPYWQLRRPRRAAGRPSLSTSYPAALLMAM